MYHINEAIAITECQFGMEKRDGNASLYLQLHWPALTRRLKTMNVYSLNTSILANRRLLHQ